MTRAGDRRQVERRAPKRGVTMRHDDPPSDEILGSKRHRRAKRASVEAAAQALELSDPAPDYREPRE